MVHARGHLSEGENISEGEDIFLRGNISEGEDIFLRENISQGEDIFLRENNFLKEYLSEGIHLSERERISPRERTSF